MSVVSNSSPIINLAAIGHLERLHDLYSTIYIPETVYEEIVVRGGGLADSDEVRTADWIIKETVTNTPLVNLLTLDLDAGEAEAIALSVERSADLVILDEKRARLKADHLGIPYIGLIGVLMECKTQSLIPSIKPLLDALQSTTGFWISQPLYHFVLDAMGETTS